MASGGSAGSNNPWAWLGLLKWSLAYTDGTKPSEVSQMSEEDRAFLEAVLKEGIIDENERMKTILKQVTVQMEEWKTESATEEQEDTMEDLLQELRDIVEQIDYARAFAAMKGLDFLLGCIAEEERMPRSTRMLCLGIIATLCQHNPPVQKELLELGSLRILSDLFFQVDESSTDSDGQFRAKIIQAISANVRSHELAESVFCELPQAPHLLELGLGLNAAAPEILLKRTLFFLNALVTSDAATRERVTQFSTCLAFVADRLLVEGYDDLGELRDMSLALVEQILIQKKSVDVIISRKNHIIEQGVRRVAHIRNLTGEERDFASAELERWESVITLLARATPDQPVDPEATQTSSILLLEKAGQEAPPQ